MPDSHGMEFDKKISQMFTVARVWAILTVVSAHITIRTSQVIANLYSTIGSIGVILFLITSGYYFKKEAPSVMIKKKMVSIVIPWIVLGSVVWLVNSILNHSVLNIQSLFLWLIGYKTYLYYVVVILACFLVFYYHNTLTLIIAFVTTAVSLLLTILGVITPVIETLHITNYLNVFNWLGFFALGIFLRKCSSKRLWLFLKETRIIALVISIFATLVGTFTDFHFGYFSPMGWLYELICTWGILGLCTYEFNNKWLYSIAHKSYAIYLTHLMFTGILAKIYGVHWITSIFANVIVVGFTYCFLTVGQKIAKLIKLKKVYNVLVGIRD